MKTIVLVVDDEELLASTLAQDLNRKGFEAAYVTRAKEALKAMDERAIDVVLSDIKMPEMDGVELLRAIKKRGQDKPKVILMTGFSSVELADAYAFGVEGVFSKPFDRKDLYKFIEKITRPADTKYPNRAERINVNFDAEVLAEKLVVPSEVSNISETGFFAIVKEFLPHVGGAVSFKIHTPYPGIVMTGKATIQWVKPNTNQQSSGCGLRFIDLEESERKMLYRLLNAIKISVK